MKAQKAESALPPTISAQISSNTPEAVICDISESIDEQTVSSFKDILQPQQSTSARVVPWREFHDYRTDWKNDIFYLFGLYCTEHSLSTLKHGEYIDDNVTNAFLTILSRENANDNMPLIFDVVIFQSYWHPTILVLASLTRH